MKTTRLNSIEGASAELYHHGAHLTSWQTAREKEWLFLSSLSLFEKGKAIRGGVPIIFPQFNEFGPGPRHGFARTSDWQLTQPPRFSNQRCECIMTLEDSEKSLAAWPYKFRADYTTAIDENSLTMTLSVTNTDSKPFQFTAALHTYLAVSDVHRVQVEGLQGLSFWNNDGSDFQQRHTESEPVLTFPNATIDRVYFDVIKPLRMKDGHESLVIGTDGFSEVVIWNPGPADAQAMLDLADLEYHNMLCIEAAVIDKPVILAPGECWHGTQSLQDQG